MGADGRKRQGKATTRRPRRRVSPERAAAAAKAGRDKSPSPAGGSTAAEKKGVGAARRRTSGRGSALPARDIILEMATTPGERPATARLAGLARVPAQPVRHVLETLRSPGEAGAPMIPGTSFSEHGVETALGWLRSQLDAGSPEVGPARRLVARVMYNFLTAPSSNGQALVAGANLDNLKRLDAMLDGDRPRPPAAQAPGPAAASEPGDYRDIVARFYDGTTRPSIVNRLLFEGSDYSNYGYWRADTTTAGEACDNMMEELLSFIPEKKGRILDVACGKGATTRYLCNYFDPSSVVGTNISKQQLEKCEQNAPGCTFLEMDATDMSFADASFDNIICIEAAFHFDTREKFLNEAHRVLKPGGRLLLADMILPPEAVHQPLANVVRDIDAYRAVLRRANFTGLKIVDATEPCIGGRFEHLGQVLRDRMSGLAARPALAYRIAREVEKRWKDQIYLLVACVKPGRSSAKARSGRQVGKSKKSHE